MAKQTGKQRTVQRPAKSAVPAGRRTPARKSAAAAKPAAKRTRAAKPAARPTTIVKRPAVLAKAVARTLKPAAKRVVVPLKAVAKSTKAAAPATKPVVKPAGITRSKPLGKSTAKATQPAAAKTPAVAKPAAPLAKASPAAAKSVGTVVAKAAKPTVVVPTTPLAAKSAPSAAKPATSPPKPAGAKPSPAASHGPVVEIKPTGRPMLSQGPFVGSTLTKRGTFAPDKLAAPAPRLPRKRPDPIVVAHPVVAPPPPSIATGDKAAKNRAGFNQRDLDFFRDLLLAKRRELLGDMSSMEREALREGSTDLSTLPVHMADQGTDAYEQEFTLGLVEKDRTLLRELNNALAKIQNGAYGICEGTGLPISKPRLEAQPWAKYSIEHARAMEKKQMMFRR